MFHKARIRTKAALVLPVLAMGLLALPVPATAQTNLAPNPCFQRSVLEGSVNNMQGPAHGQLIQPGLPDGWVFEGSTGLFDYADTRADVIGIGGRTHVCGQFPRFLAVSIPLSGKPVMCDAGPCVDLGPTVDAKWAAAQYYTVNPAWRTALPIAVQPGRSYTLSAHVLLDFVTEGSGGFLAIRWLDGNGVPVGLSRQNVITSLQGWRANSLTATSPASARSAVLLLGHLDDLWLGQVRFDNVFFG